jgi:Uma2 family endonuclease
MQNTETTLQLRLWTVEEYHRMAEAGISDYWVLDVVNRQLHVFRQPTEDGYESEEILSEEQTISPLEFPDLQIGVFEMLPPMII